MIQFNLLPDVKVQYIKTQRLKHVLVLVAILATAVSVAIMLFSISYSAVQKRHLANLDNDIKKLSSELQGNSELTKILSVQNQLNSLPALYEGRPAIDRLPGYIDQTTPTEVGIGLLNIDFSTNVIEISGQAPSFVNINSYVDTLKYTNFKIGEDGESRPAFSSVVLSQFGVEGGEASFLVSFNFDPEIFNINNDISLSVPSIVTTRSQASPAELFDGSNQDAQGGGEENGGQ